VLIGLGLVKDINLSVHYSANVGIAPGPFAKSSHIDQLLYSVDSHCNED